jgi:prepilin-type N-terminal cleavage/methylation domain-containing protein
MRKMEKPASHPSRSGFTLIELSIVLVVIGLLIGGVLVGKDLIHAAELRSVVTDVNSIKIAISAYKLKYDYLPGDDPTAQRHFGAVACPDDDIPTNQVCNGNGDGFIQDGVNQFETYKVTEHLSLASLLPGSFTGKYGDPPAKLWQPSKISGGVYRITTNPTVYGREGNYLLLGNPATFFTQGSVLSSNDAYAIDGKIDDGVAWHGDVFSYNGQDVLGNHCTTGDYNLASGNYILPSDSIYCVMVFWLD